MRTLHFRNQPGVHLVNTFYFDSTLVAVKLGFKLFVSDCKVEVEREIFALASIGLVARHHAIHDDCIICSSKQMVSFHTHKWYRNQSLDLFLAAQSFSPPASRRTLCLVLIGFLSFVQNNSQDIIAEFRNIDTDLLPLFFDAVAKYMALRRPV